MSSEEELLYFYEETGFQYHKGNCFKVSFPDGATVAFPPQKILSDDGRTLLLDAVGDLWDLSFDETLSSGVGQATADELRLLGKNVLNFYFYDPICTQKSRRKVVLMLHKNHISVKKTCAGEYQFEDKDELLLRDDVHVKPFYDTIVEGSYSECLFHLEEGFVSLDIETMQWSHTALTHAINTIEGIIKILYFDDLVTIIDDTHTLHVLHQESGKTLYTRAHVVTIWEYTHSFNDGVIMVCEDGSRYVLAVSDSRGTVEFVCPLISRHVIVASGTYVLLSDEGLILELDRPEGTSFTLIESREKALHGVRGHALHAQQLSNGKPRLVASKPKKSAHME